MGDIELDRPGGGRQGECESGRKTEFHPHDLLRLLGLARVRRALSPVQGIDVISPQVRPTTRLKSILARRTATLMPGAANALFARIVEDLGFEACYVTGAGIANMHLGAPDIGLTTLTEVANHVAAMTDAVALPLLVDADTGFGNALSVVRTVKVLERAGAAGLQIEDQVFPKRCGHSKARMWFPWPRCWPRSGPRSTRGGTAISRSSPGRTRARCSASTPPSSGRRP